MTLVIISQAHCFHMFKPTGSAGLYRAKTVLLPFAATLKCQMPGDQAFVTIKQGPLHYEQPFVLQIVATKTRSFKLNI